ncbi:MAG: SGNH/GDSL hydrolase family protein [Thermoguttaceae bacterium]|nr:SGNH/GDSL hydrolase family protein [Thermoguttaceae bacterium]
MRISRRGFTGAIALSSVMMTGLRPLFGAKEAAAKLGERIEEPRWILPFWATPTAFEEEVMFISQDGKQPAAAKLFYQVKKILEVKSATHQLVFEEGKDYTFDAATHALVLTANSKIPFITGEQMYPSKDDPTPNKYPFHRGDPEHFMFFGEGSVFHQLQVAVTYEHDDLASWNGPKQTFVGDAALPKTFEKLRSHEPFVLAISGDSISTGANASGAVNAEPFQPDYPHLIADGLSDLYRTDVRLVNCAVGGWTTQEGVNDLARPAKEKPQLVVIAYGMNDSGGRSVEDYIANMRKIIDGIRAENPEAEFVLVASMLPNAEWAYPRLEMFPIYRDALKQLCEEVPGCVFVNVTDVWAELLTKKTYYDLTGNGVNHPNDFGHRLYAQAILAVLTDPAMAAEYYGKAKK